MYNPLTGSKFPQPLDKIALTAIAVLLVAIVWFALVGERVPPRVVNFSWSEQQISADDRAFIMTFSRPMDTESVAENLRLDPPLPGKISWAGRRMAYTLNSPIPYGTRFQIALEGARDAYSQQGQERKIQPFSDYFSSRDRVFAYLGVDGEERGRLMLVNLTNAKDNLPVALTPKDLIVSDFQPYPQGDRILFAATDRRHFQKEGTYNNKLYSVTTGIRSTDAPPDTPKPEAGKITQILGNQNYKNLRFDLSPDGKTIAVQRASRQNPGSDFGVWVLREGESPQRLPTKAGGEFAIAPDSKTLAMTQGQGIAILPLDPERQAGESTVEPIEFLPEYGQILGFDPDGSQAALVKFNSDYTRSLFLANIQGEETEILRTKGSILSATFDPTGQTLYCVLTDLIEGEQYVEQPYIASYNLQTQNWLRLWNLPQQRDIQISLAPDGLSLLFDRLVANNSDSSDSDRTLRTETGMPIESARIWILPLVPPTAADQEPEPKQPEKLPLDGLRPRWIR